MKEAEVVAAAIVWTVILVKFRPLRFLQRLIIYTRAAGFFLAIAAQRVWTERHWWGHCVQRARREV